MRMIVNIDVPDLEGAERFYTAALGLTPSRRFAGGALELLGASCPVYLLHKPPGTVSAGRQTRRYDRHWTPVHLDIVVEEIETELDRAVAAGATLEQAAQDAPFGRIAMLADPFGHGFCLIQFSARGYDALLDPDAAVFP